MSEPMTTDAIRELWEDYCEAANPNCSMGDIDLYDIDGMFEAAQSMHAALVAMQARLAAAEKMAEALDRLAQVADDMGDFTNCGMAEDAIAKAHAARAAWEAAR